MQVGKLETAAGGDSEQKSLGVWMLMTMRMIEAAAEFIGSQAMKEGYANKKFTSLDLAFKELKQYMQILESDE